MRVIDTPRLYLREYEADDAGRLAKILADPRAMAYAPMAVTADRSAAEELIAWHRRNYLEHGFGAWAAIAKDGNAFAGQAGLLPHERDVELFYSFHPDFWGRGLATEAALACRDYAFGRLGLTRLIGIIHPENRAAIAVAVRVGMTRAGSLRMWGRDNALYEVRRAAPPDRGSSGQIQDPIGS